MILYYRIIVTIQKEGQILKEYAQYVAKVRECARSSALDVAVEEAVNYCIQNDILAEFLRKNRSEVIATSIFEYNKEEEEKKLRKAEYEAGIQEGKLQKTKEVAITLSRSGFPVKKIEELLHVGEETILEWIKESTEN